MSTVSKKVEDLVVGDRVDLESCPYLKDHASAKSEYALVAHVERESPECVVIGYEGIDHIGYPIGTNLQVRAPIDVPDPVVKVRPVGKPEEWKDWKISQNLTTRDGDLNYHDAENKPLEFLEFDEDLLARLRAQMWDGITFITRKDGKFGLLFEMEFCSLESEEENKNDDPAWYAALKPHADVIKTLLDGLKPLAERFPGVEFAVPDEAHIANDRPAAWAFVPDGLLSDEQREELGKALLNL